MYLPAASTSPPVAVQFTPAVAVEPSAKYAVAAKVRLAPGSSVVASGEMARRTTSVAGGTTTTMAVSDCFQPRPRPTTLNVPVRLEENVPLAVMVPPVELHAVAEVNSSPRVLREWPRKRMAWPTSAVTRRGDTLKTSACEGADATPSGAVVTSLVQAATRARKASMAHSRETASLRASLKVYVMFQPFLDSPCDCPNLSRQSTTALGLRVSMANLVRVQRLKNIRLCFAAIWCYLISYWPATRCAAL